MTGDPDGWRAFGLRGLPSMSGRVNTELSAVASPLIDERVAGMHEPFVGITSAGSVRHGLRSLDGRRASTQPIADAASAFLQALPDEQRAQARLAMDADEWRAWTNIHMALFRHGVLLEQLPPVVRELALGVLRSTLSARGYAYARGVMELNELVAVLCDDHEAFGGWLYFLTIFGEPDQDEPWGWQIDGHHLCINTVVVDGCVSITPAFVGSEPRSHGAMSLFDPEEERALTLMRSLDDVQRHKALVHPSIHPDDLPDRQHVFDGRQVAGAGHDNVVVPYEGITAGELSDAQRSLLLDVAATYTGWIRDDHAAVHLSDIADHLDETWFSWYGGTGDTDAFYYRLHSPVVLIEFDHHAGIVFDNDVPSRHHVHMMVRTPNGGDYGRDLLREHYERFDHHGGVHTPR